MHLGTRVRQLLRKRGWKQAELARRVGVTRQTISYICRGGDPSIALLRRIAAELEVDEAHLLDGTDAPARTLRSGPGADSKAAASG